MKKVFIISSLYLVLISCNSSSNNGVSGSNSDSTGTGTTSQGGGDTTLHPDGMANSSVISTDTAAMNTTNAIKKAKDSLKK